MRLKVYLNRLKHLQAGADLRTVRGSFWWIYLAVVSLGAAAALAACGSTSTADSGSVLPTIVSVKSVEHGVRVNYSDPGAEGGEWPVLKISVRKTNDVLPPSGEIARPIEQEGSVVVPIEVEPHEDLVVYGSVFYEDGRRLYLPEKHFRS